MGIVLIAFSEEGLLFILRYLIKLSLVQTFIIISGVGLCILVFIWLPIYNKVFTITENWQKGKHIPSTRGFKKIRLKFARWIAKNHNYYEKYRHKKKVKIIKSLGHFGLYLSGLIPFLFHPGMCAYKIFIQSRLGPLCIWLGGVTRLALYVFAGLRLIDLIF